MIRHLRLILTLLLLPSALALMAQSSLRQMNDDGTSSSALNRNIGAGDTDDGTMGSNRMVWGRDTTSSKGEKFIPIGLHQWRIDPILGTVIPTENNDTVPNHYNNFNNTDGYNGEYSYLGNLGSPRLSRIFMNRNEYEAPFLFMNPYSFEHQGLKNLLFTNTLSPITNLSYHSCGTRLTGEDRVRAYFASNINKLSGIGFKVDYLYGRGYYASQQASDINADFFGYYLGERYNMHAWVGNAHQKNAENGGIEEDRYIRDPQSFPQRYRTTDIPVMLTDAYNRNDFRNYHLSQRYNLGYFREKELPDSLKPQMPEDKDLLLTISDSLRQIAGVDSLFRMQILDSLHNAWTQRQIIPTEFVPVASFIHTLQISRLGHTHYDGTINQATANYYTYNYYGTTGKQKDRTKALRVRNTVGLAMQEGFRKWVKMGLTAYAAHEYHRYQMPALLYPKTGPGLVKWDDNNLPIIPEEVGSLSYTKNNIMVGGQLSKRDGKLLHYDVTGEFNIAGDDIGDFNVQGQGDLNFALGKRDTVRLDVNAYIKNLTPDFYYKRYHSRHTWWDNSLSQEFRTRLQGKLSNQRSRTSISVGVENVKNYTYFNLERKLLSPDKASSVNNRDYSHNVTVCQKRDNLQVFSAALRQDFKLGPLNWENEITYQVSSDQDVLPLPQVNIYSNLYLLFRIAKVLRVEMGGDIRYFTNYYAPDYAPSIGQFATQDATHPRVKCGNYPIINAYVNLHIKHCRIYVAGNHVNAGTGRMFLAPHCPINPLTLHWGVSWNFFN